MKNKFLGLLAALGIFVPLSLAGGLYLGSTVMTAWLSLKAEPSVGMLYRYWQNYGRLKPDVQTALDSDFKCNTRVPVV